MKNKIQILIISCKPEKEILGENKLTLLLGFDKEAINNFKTNVEVKKIETFNLTRVTRITRPYTFENIVINRSAIDSYNTFEIELMNDNFSLDLAVDEFVNFFNQLHIFTNMYLEEVKDTQILVEKKIFEDNFNTINKLNESSNYLMEKGNELNDKHNKLIEDYNELNDSRNEIIDKYQIVFNKYNALYDDYIKLIDKYNDSNKRHTKEVHSLQNESAYLAKSFEQKQEQFENNLKSRKVICPNCKGTGKTYKEWIGKWGDYHCDVCNGKGRVTEYE